MIHSFAITNYLGDRIKLDLREPEVSGFLIKSVTGLGPVKATVNTTEVVTNDGSMFNSARLSQRNIVFQIVFVDTVYGETIEDVRQKSYKYFPAKKSVEIIIETDNRYVRTSGYVESNEPNIFSSQEGTSISIICPDPFFYSAGEDGNNVTDFYSIDPMFEFPFSNESLTEPLLVFGRNSDQDGGCHHLLWRCRNRRNDLYSCNRTGKQHQYLQYGNQRSHEDRYCEAPKADWKGYRRK